MPVTMGLLEVRAPIFFPRGGLWLASPHLRICLDFVGPRDVGVGWILSPSNNLFSTSTIFDNDGTNGSERASGHDGGPPPPPPPNEPRTRSAMRRLVVVASLYLCL